MPDGELIKRATQFHPWDAMAPAALERLTQCGPLRHSAETGCGGSTIVLSHISAQHTAFAINGADRTISELAEHPDLCPERVRFIEGESKHTIPGHSFEGPLDLVLLDGPHAYPLPQVEFAYLFPHLAPSGWLVLDDLQIPSVFELFRFLEKDDSVSLDCVVLRTAFFRKAAAELRNEQAGPDGWERQGINRRLVLRYSWRDQLRRALLRR